MWKRVLGSGRLATAKAKPQWHLSPTRAFGRSALQRTASQSILSVIPNQIDADSPEFKENTLRMEALVQDLKSKIDKIKLGIFGFFEVVLPWHWYNTP
jgi:hypothetical protein